MGKTQPHSSDGDPQGVRLESASTLGRRRFVSLATRGGVIVEAHARRRSEEDKTVNGSFATGNRVRC